MVLVVFSMYSLRGWGGSLVISPPPPPPQVCRDKFLDNVSPSEKLNKLNSLVDFEMVFFGSLIDVKIYICFDVQQRAVRLACQ